MQRFKTLLTVIGAVTILVLAANSAAYAATGGKFLLGRTNKANKVSTLKRTTAGPALSLITTSSAAPLSVTGAGKVAHLNADLLDGLDSTALKSVRSRAFQLNFLTPAGSHDVNLPSVAAGVYLATYDVGMNGVTGSPAAPATVNCALRQTHNGVTRIHGAVQVTVSASSVPMISGATVLTVAAGDVVGMTCNGPAPWTAGGNGGAVPAEVTLTKLDGGSVTPVDEP